MMSGIDGFLLHGMSITIVWYQNRPTPLPKCFFMQLFVERLYCMLYVTCHMLHYNDMLRLILSISILHFLVKKIDWEWEWVYLCVMWCQVCFGNDVTVVLQITLYSGEPLSHRVDILSEKLFHFISGIRGWQFSHTGYQTNRMSL